MIDNKIASWKIDKVNSKGAFVILHNVRLTFVYIAKPKFPDKSDPKQKQKAVYGVTAIIPNSEYSEIEKDIRSTLEQVVSLSDLSDTEKKDALANALNYLKKGSLIREGSSIINKNTNSPYPDLVDCKIIRPKTDAVESGSGIMSPIFPLFLVDKNNISIPKESLEFEFYSGIYADISFKLRAYPEAGLTPAGVTSYLTGVMKIKDGERIGGKSPFSSRDDIEDSSPEVDEQF